MKQIAIDVLERHARGGTWWFDLDTEEIWWSEGIYRIHGVDPSEYKPTPETVVSLYEPESRARVNAAIEQAVEHGRGWNLILLLRRPDGQLRYVHSVAQVETRPGKAPLIAGAFFDVHEPTMERIEREAREQQLSEQQSRRWRIASENAGLALIDFDNERYRVSGAFAHHMGFRSEGDVEISCEQWRAFVHPDDRKVRQKRLLAHLAGETQFYVSEYRLRLPAAREIWVREAGRCADEGDGVNAYRLIGTLSDISERKRAERAVFQAKQLAEVTFEAIGEGLMRVDRKGRITEVNSAACTLLGRAPETVVKQRFTDTIELYDAAREQRLPDPVAQVLRHGKRVRVPIFTRLRRSDGSFISIVDSISPIQDENGAVQGAVFVFQDISEARRMTDDLVHQVNHDELTGLPNRRGFEQALDSAWQRVRAGMARIYIIYLDIDHFKTVNDTFGHAVGDDLLRQSARALRSILRDNEMLARLGGDEFAAIVNAKNAERVETIARKLIAAIADLRLTYFGQTCAVGVSLDIAALDAGLPSTETALTRADAALYVAKDAGRGRYHVYDQASLWPGQRADSAGG